MISFQEVADFFVGIDGGLLVDFGNVVDVEIRFFFSDDQGCPDSLLFQVLFLSQGELIEISVSDGGDDHGFGKCAGSA